MAVAGIVLDADIVGAGLPAMRPDRSTEISDQLNSSPTGYRLAFKLSLILRKCGWKSTPRRKVMPVASTSSTVSWMIRDVIGM
ncbi:hypothetical protein D3C84_1014730 [compost metagenome]